MFPRKNDLSLASNPQSSAAHLVPHSLLSFPKLKTANPTSPMAKRPLSQESVDHVLSKHPDLIPTLVFLSSRLPPIVLQRLSHSFRWRIYTSQAVLAPLQSSSQSLLVEHRKIVSLNPPLLLIHLALASLSEASMLPLPISNLNVFSTRVADDTSQMVSRFAPPVVILRILPHCCRCRHRRPFLGAYQSRESEETRQNWEKTA